MRRKETKRKTEIIFFYDYERRIIWLEGQISSQTALIFESVLKKLNKINHDDIHFFINGPGGDFYACLKMIKLIKSSQSKFVIVPFGVVRSGHFFLTQAENCKQRLAVTGTKFVFHHAVDIFLRQKLSRVTMGQNDYEKRRKILQLIDAAQVVLFCEKGRPIRKIFELFNQEATISTGLAKRINLIDGLFPREKFLKYKRIFGQKRESA